MIEDEAKTKWCPLFSVGAAVASLQQERPDNALLDQFKRCKGSDCMMFRTELRFQLKDGVEAGPFKRLDEMETKYVSYCGLAGRP